MSNGANSYKNFMRALKAVAEKKGTLLTVEDFTDVAVDFVPKEEIENKVQQYIMEGKMIPKEEI